MGRAIFPRTTNQMAPFVNAKWILVFSGAKRLHRVFPGWDFLECQCYPNKDVAELREHKEEKRCTPGTSDAVPVVRCECPLSPRSIPSRDGTSSSQRLELDRSIPFQSRLASFRNFREPMRKRLAVGLQAHGTESPRPPVMALCTGIARTPGRAHLPFSGSRRHSTDSPNCGNFARL